MQHVVKKKLLARHPGGFLRAARSRIRLAEIAEKIWREKAPSLKDALVYWKKNSRADAYIVKSADFAKPIRATITTHERADGCRSILNPCRRLGDPGSDRQV
jgi:hypothetical protein